MSPGARDARQAGAGFAGGRNQATIDVGFLGRSKDTMTDIASTPTIRHLHEKMNHMLRRQWNRLFEIQPIQIELLEELNESKEKRS